jgi:hypothetical protein
MRVKALRLVSTDTQAPTANSNARRAISAALGSAHIINHTYDNHLIISMEVIIAV